MAQVGPLENKHTDETDSSFWSIRPRRKYDSSLALLTFSMGFFLCITSSVIMSTVICNFSMNYQNRDVLLKVVDFLHNEDERSPTTLKLTSETEATENDSTSVEWSKTTTVPLTSSLADSSTYFSRDPSTEPSASASMEPSSTTRSSEDTELSSSPYETSTTEFMQDTNTVPSTTALSKIDPVSLLKQVHFRGVTYTFTNCPTAVVNVQLDLTISTRGNYLRLNLYVNTTVQNQAKNAAAHYALTYLYKEHLIRCNYEERPPIVSGHSCNYTGGVI